MIPVVTGLEIRRIEKIAISQDCIEEHFMLQAGKSIANEILCFLQKHSLKKHVSVFVGKGNKGGDALVSAKELLIHGIAVDVFCLYSEKESSPLNQKFRKEILEKTSLKIVSCPEDIDIENSSCIIDGIYGSAFAGEMPQSMQIITSMLNASSKPIIAIDVPSGLDCTTGDASPGCIKATITISLEFFKSGFFLKNGWNFVGEVIVKEFGLPQKYKTMVQAQGVSFTEDVFASMLPEIVRNRHKYMAGYVLGFAGSKEYVGAPKLACLASLKVGAGIVRVMSLDEIGEPPLSVIAQKFSKKAWAQEIKRSKAVFMGSGIGLKKKAKLCMKTLLKNSSVPCVVDADAIDGSFSYSKRQILTPHRGEVLRLLKQKKINELELFENLQKWVDKYQSIVVLKGAPTVIFSSNRLPIFMPFGDPGMAKAGVGDVLTGVIAGFLAQEMQLLEAAVLGVYIHAKAGEIAAGEKTSFGMTAKDVLKMLPKAIEKLLKKDA